MLDKLHEKVENDYNNYIETIKAMSKEDVVRNAYDIFHAQNFLEHIDKFVEDYYDEDEENYPITKEMCERIINYDGNIITFWLNHKYEIRHSERFNLEDFNDFIYVLDGVLGWCE